MFDYDAMTGVIRWRSRPRSEFKNAQAFGAWNTKFVGKAITCKRTGYIVVSLDGKLWCAHRIIFKMVYGEEPSEIDHEDRNRSNNRIANLRAADPTTNKHNTVARRTNQSGLKGVSKQNGPGWHARIYVNGKTKCLGTYDTPERAHAAYCAAADLHHGAFANHG